MAITMNGEPNLKTPFELLKLGAIQPSGWMHDQLQRDLDIGFASLLDALTNHAANDLFKHRIETAAEQYAWWNGETRGNWLWGYTMMAFLANDADHKARVTSLLKELISTQDEDGYIGIYSPQSRYSHGQSENGELWTQSRALLPLLAYYEFTDDATVLQSVDSAAQLTMKHYGPHQRYFPEIGDPLHHLIGVTHGLCYVDVMVWLYKLTGNTAYRDFGVWLYDDFNTTTIPFICDDLALSNLLEPHRTFNHHSAHTAEHLRVLFWTAKVTGRENLHQALPSALNKLRHCVLPSGALIGDEGIHGLPLPDMGYEYCTTTELMLSLSSLVQLFGDHTVGDQVENIAFNAAQGARMADGTAVSYLSQDTRLDTLTSRHDSYSLLHGEGGRFKYSPTHEDVACCCNPSAVRLLPHYISRMWMQLPENRGLVAMFYGPCVVNTNFGDVNVIIEETTQYPFEEKITFTLTTTQPIAFRLGLRKPAWAKSVHVTVEDAEMSDENGYIFITKTWSQNEQVVVNFEAPIEIVKYPNGEYAVRRGALQYVHPIEAEIHTLKTYNASDLVDFEAVPQDLAQAYTPIILDGAKLDYGLELQQWSDRDPDRPWDKSPLGLVIGRETLVPMGCTMLRRAAFPVKLSRLKSE